MALGLGAGPATRAQPSFFLCPYSPKCLEVEFSEVRGSKVEFEVALRGIGVGLRGGVGTN
jgi:hypothetical protein